MRLDRTQRRIRRQQTMVSVDKRCQTGLDGAKRKIMQAKKGECG